MGTECVPIRKMRPTAQNQQASLHYKNSCSSANIVYYHCKKNGINRFCRVHEIFIRIKNRMLFGQHELQVTYQFGAGADERAMQVVVDEIGVLPNLVGTSASVKERGRAERMVFQFTVRRKVWRSLSRDELPTIIVNVPGSTPYFIPAS